MNALCPTCYGTGITIRSHQTTRGHGRAVQIPCRQCTGTGWVRHDHR